MNKPVPRWQAFLLSASCALAGGLGWRSFDSIGTSTIQNAVQQQELADKAAQRSENVLKRDKQIEDLTAAIDKLRESEETKLRENHNETTDAIKAVNGRIDAIYNALYDHDRK